MSFITINKRQRVAVNLLNSWGPLCIKIYEGTPYGMTQIFNVTVTSSVEVILTAGIGGFNFGNLSAIITTF